MINTVSVLGILCGAWSWGEAYIKKHKEQQPAASSLLLCGLMLLLGLFIYPNLAELSFREIHGRTISDYRVIIDALADYHMAHQSYPEHLQPELTTPVAYLGRDQLRDRYQVNQWVPYGYIHDQSGYLIFSIGPDGVKNLEPEKEFNPILKGKAPRLMEKRYDPTNGTLSAGDIMWVQ